MKRLLAVDTATWWGSVALVELAADGRAEIVADCGERIDSSHSERLVHWIERLLEDSGWPKNSIDAYAATRGPGSFTGIRVGLGTIRGLGLATGRPCHGVTTLEAIAEAVGPCDRARFPVMEAGRGELYAAGFDAASSPPVARVAPWLDRASAVLARIASDDGMALPGPGTRLAPESASGSELHVPERLAGAAGKVAALRGEHSDALTPLYIRPPDAILKRLQG